MIIEDNHFFQKLISNLKKFYVGVIISAWLIRIQFSSIEITVS